MRFNNNILKVELIFGTLGQVTPMSKKNLINCKQTNTQASKLQKTILFYFQLLYTTLVSKLFLKLEIQVIHRDENMMFYLLRKSQIPPTSARSNLVSNSNYLIVSFYEFFNSTLLDFLNGKQRSGRVALLSCTFALISFGLNQSHFYLVRKWCSIVHTQVNVLFANIVQNKYL